MARLISILVDLLDFLQMFPTSVSRNVAGDLFVEMHDHSLVFMLMNDVLQFIMHEEWCYFTIILFLFLFAVSRYTVDELGNRY